jgi:predicted  nucleic acid-binding Zn-ribbon protein
MTTREDALKDQLLFLLQLQTIDLQVKELEASRTKLPTRTDPLRNDLVKLEGMLTAERQKVTETETWKRQQALILERDQDALRAAKSKLQGTKTGKEFHAATREVEFKKKSIHEREIELKKVGEALGSSGTVIGERDVSVQRLRDELTSEEARIQGQLDDLSQQIAQIAEGRAALRARIEKHWLKAYDSLIVRGVAVSPVVSGVCQGCRVRIPPQLNNKLARLETIETCERCARIIYRKEMLEPPAPTQAEGDTPGGGAPSGDAPAA